MYLLFYMSAELGILTKKIIHTKGVKRQSDLRYVLRKINSPMCNVIVKIKVFTLASMNMTVCWDIAPCKLVETDRRFSGDYCLHYQGDRPTRLHGTTSEKSSSKSIIVL
jgi:hypothetical protein